ncbi:hypothetical protein D7322_25715 [Sphingobacterium puteale]|uniref:Uncharacterized protein n=1 Tax=Sphingobacterium puteale TaxID=2420510 RepID=A0A420VRD2_9SPHI|nr:hypothetical protein D7322_25715 [Sphingobacterium puteale]
MWKLRWGFPSIDSDYDLRFI